MPTRTQHAAGTALDLAVLGIAMAASWGWEENWHGATWMAMGSYLGHAALFGAIWLLVTTRFGTYRLSVRRHRGAALRSVAEAWATTWGVAGLLDVSLLGPTLLSVPSPHMGVLFASGLLGLLGARLLASGTRFGDGFGRPRTVVAGACASARNMTLCRDAQRNMEFVGFAPFPTEDSQAMPHLANLGPSTALAKIAARHQIDLVLVCPSDQVTTGEIHEVIAACDRTGLGVQYFPSFLDLQHLSVGLAFHADRTGLSLHSPPNESLGLLAKRTLDLVGATAGILALLPVFAACGLAVKLTSPGPMFYRQTRVGKNGATFTCYKFRTMRVGAHAQQELLRAASTQDGPAFKIPDDPRITRVGRILRKFSLDELPQLLNVLVGDMSLVGPRPPIPSEVEKYTWWQRRRIAVKPGLTCVWQVWGRNRVSFKRWVEMDLYYIDNWSLWLDLKLIAHTFRAVLGGTGM
jgi:exopolysaccharide biosynthesis polyprenyl glycosylphosphotransferase